MAFIPPKDNISPSWFGFEKKPWIWVPFTLLLIFLIILTQIDLESIKENLVERISNKTGLKVEIDSIGFGVLDGLGLQCKGVEVTSLNGNHYSIDRLDLLAAWSPLLRGEFEITSASLIHPVIKLVIPEKPKSQAKNEQPEKEKSAGHQELVSPETLESTTKKIKETPLTIDKLVISDGQITLTHPESTKQLLLNVDGTFELIQAEGIDILAKAVKVETESIVFEGGGTVSYLGKDNTKVAMNINTGGYSLKEIESILHFFGVSVKEIPLQAINIDRLLLNAQFPLNSLRKIEALKKQMTGHIDLKTRKVIVKEGYSIEALEGEASLKNGVLIHNFFGTALGSEFRFNGNLPISGLGKESISRIEWKNLDTNKIPLKIDNAWIPNQGKVSGKLSIIGPFEKSQLKGSFEFQADDLIIEPANETPSIEISKLTGHGDFDKGQLQHEFHGNVLGSEFNIKGKVRMSTDNTTLNSQINWTELDVSRLPPGEGWYPAEGMLSGVLSLKGPLPAEGDEFPGKIKASVNIKAQNLKLHNANSAKTIFLKELEGNGEIKNHQVNYDLRGNTLNGTFRSDGTITLPSSKSSPPFLNNTTKLTHIDLSQLPIALKQGDLSVTINLKGPLSDTENFLTGKLKIDTSFKVNDLIITTGVIPLNIQHLAGKASLQKGKLSHNLNSSLLGGTLKAQGMLAFKKQKDQIHATTDSVLVLDNVSLNWGHLVHKKAPSSGTVTANLKINGPLPFNKKLSPDLKLEGVLIGKKLVLENHTMESVKLNFEESTSNSTQVQIKLDKARLGDKRFKKILAFFKITPQKINLTKGKVWPSKGLILLAGNLKPKSGEYQIKFKGEELQAEDLLSKHLMGPLQFSGSLAGFLPKDNDVPELPDYSRDLSGDIKIKLTDGAIPKLGMLENFLTLLNPNTALNAQKEGLSYDYLGGNFKIVKGVVHTNSFEVKSPQINLTVTGKADLVKDTVLAQVKAMPLQMLDKTIKAIPLLGAILGGGKKGGVIETYFTMYGKLSQPKFTMEAHKTLTEKPGSILKGLLNLPKNLTEGK
jgi:hypothetical protein